MINNKQFFDIVKFQITNGSHYPNASYSSTSYLVNSVLTGFFCATCVFDLKTREVYEIQVADTRKSYMYRWVHPDFRDSAPDLYKVVDLEVESDILEKLTAIVNCQWYDTRVVVPITLTDEEFLTIAKAAHAEDITFNEFIELALLEAVQKFELEPKA